MSEFITGGSPGVGAATLEIKLILCPIDFSEFSQRAYQHALSLAEHYQAKLVVQHVVELWRHPSASFAASGGLYEEFRQVLRETGEDHLQQFVMNHAHDKIQPELVVHEGSAPDSILSFAQTQKADLIVMGTHGRRGFDRLMLGSVIDRGCAGLPAQCWWYVSRRTTLWPQVKSGTISTACTEFFSVRISPRIQSEL